MNEVLTLAQQLIARSSVTPHDAGCQTIIADRLTALGFHCEPMPFDAVTNLWARWGDKKPLFVFAGHTDVVPSGPLSQWSSPPFEPVIKNGNLYGRGASDMKAAIAAMIIAVEEFLQTQSDFPGSIGFLLTSDEEGPALHGTVKVMENLLKRNENIDYCIVGEPSSDQQVGDRIRIGRRGSLHGKLTIYGKQGHVAYPEVADNPIHKSMFALHELTHTKWDEGNEFYPPTSFQISNIHSGNGTTNLIPSQMEVLCNFRFSTAVTPLELQERSEAILKKHGLKNKISWETTALPFLSKKGNLLTVVKQAILAITGLNVEASTGGGTSDGRFISKTGAEVIELGMTNATAHHADEHIQLNDLITLKNIYNKILHIIYKDNI